MPWKTKSAMERRHEFVLRANAPGANRRALCREYGIAPNTGYRWLRRFRELGLRGLDNRRSGPVPGRSPLKISPEMTIEVLRLRRLHPTWGSAKLRAVLDREWHGAAVPSTRTIDRVLRQAGLTARRRKRRTTYIGPLEAPEIDVQEPNDLWTVDFKGWWRAGNGQKVEPLTVRDQHSRFMLCIELVDAPSIAAVRPVFESLFIDYGLPRAILTDNGSPFATTKSPIGLTRLSAWWVSLGIRVVRSRVGCPQDNGGHERMHRDMKAELQRRPAWDRHQQQDHCDLWRHEFNCVRPHQALGQKSPVSVYRGSPRVFPASKQVPVYPSDFAVRKVTPSGTVRYSGHQRYLSVALEGHHVGFEPLDDKRFRVWFFDQCLGEGRLPWKAAIRPLTQDQQPTQTTQLELDL